MNYVIESAQLAVLRQCAKRLFAEDLDGEEMCTMARRISQVISECENREIPPDDLEGLPGFK